jgi:hypothetical protein
LDQWHTVPGDQLPEFMESAVRQNRFVLIICTPHYKDRAEKRIGGVGYEGDIITAEVMTSRNQRKFIPIRRRGSWAEAAPNWLAGKYYINMSGDPYSEDSYSDLLMTLLGTRPKAPPIGKSRKSRRHHSMSEQRVAEESEDREFEPIKITNVIEDEVGVPRNDGTRGSALYEVPLRLSRRPPPEWAKLFEQTWDHPPRFTTAHRPGIARVSGDKVILDGTTIDEVAQYHRDTLLLVLDEVNEKYKVYDATRRQREKQKAQKLHEHKGNVKDTASRIKFDE